VGEQSVINTVGLQGILVEHELLLRVDFADVPVQGCGKRRGDAGEAEVRLSLPSDEFKGS
jgi:hypothetical protein